MRSIVMLPTTTDRGAANVESLDTGMSIATSVGTVGQPSTTGENAIDARATRVKEDNPTPTGATS